MKRPVTLALAAAAAATLVSCRGYDYRDRISQNDGLMPAEQFARYGREQAQLVAAGRELAQDLDTARAAGYARGLPDVAGVTTDAKAHWLELRFKSGWRAAIPPIADGKRGDETAGLPARR